jgi:F-type H+-transporting ATPase subunit b
VINTLVTFASESSSGNKDLFQALGIDGRLLLLQGIAFLILVWALGKWVYPVLIKAIDQRQATLEAGIKASQDAQTQAEKSEEKMEKALQDVRKEADDILALAHKEANNIVELAEDKATKRADHIVAEAKDQLDTQIQAARQTLKAETLKLVASATEQIIDEKVDAQKDAQLVKKAIANAGGDA